MVRLTDIYSSVSALFMSKYPEYKIHGYEAVEGFSKPSFFIDPIAKTISNETKNFNRYAYTIKITYYQEVISEIDNLRKIDEIRELFGCKLKVNERYITVLDFSYAFVGDNANRLQMNVEIEYFEQIYIANNNDLANELKLESEVQ